LVFIRPTIAVKSETKAVARVTYCTAADSLESPFGSTPGGGAEKNRIKYNANAHTETTNELKTSFFDIGDFSQ
jgi:hypothetical protein